MKILTSAYYLDFVNNFLSFEAFAEYYDITIEQAQSIIARSKICYQSEHHAHREGFTYNWSVLKTGSRNKIFHHSNANRRLLLEYSA